MAISKEVANVVLSKSGRHCCLCREFSPLTVQVHHIIEQNEGGTDEIDNLIPLCTNCHSSIHTKTKMTRGFSPEELKLHRDNVYKLISEGKLSAHSNTMTQEEILNFYFKISQVKSREGDVPELSEEAFLIISTALCENAEIIMENILNKDHVLTIGGQKHFIKKEENRQYPPQIIELMEKGFIVAYGTTFEITDDAIKYISATIHNTDTYTQCKVKCLTCGVHFIICSWYQDRHDCENIFCPECGSKNGRFIVWKQKKFGYIFEDVPGNAVVSDIHY